MSAASAAPAGLLLTDDLLFASRITAAAQTLGQQVRCVRAVSELDQPWSPRCIFLDLSCVREPLENLVPRLRQHHTPPPLIVAFGAHVDVAGLRAARQAGCDVVLPRSKLVQELPRCLPHWLAGSIGPPGEPSAGA